MPQLTNRQLREIAIASARAAEALAHRKAEAEAQRAAPIAAKPTGTNDGKK